MATGSSDRPRASIRRPMADQLSAYPEVLRVTRGVGPPVGTAIFLPADMFLSRGHIRDVSLVSAVARPDERMGRTDGRQSVVGGAF